MANVATVQMKARVARCVKDVQSHFPSCETRCVEFALLQDKVCNLKSRMSPLLIGFEDADASAIPPSAPLPIDQALNPVAQPPPQFSLLNSMNTAMLNVPNPRAASQQSKSTQPRSGQWSAVSQ
jgi:hypothetical protein